mmetsp:Transcript_66594/g.187553  ORF Transcript_66594/g.187553 Transcript_66594/m.187553 type:complete len:283 (+) Transcript_66594:579-1427(+)
MRCNKLCRGKGEGPQDPAWAQPAVSKVPKILSPQCIKARCETAFDLVSTDAVQKLENAKRQYDEAAAWINEPKSGDHSLMDRGKSDDRAARVAKYEPQKNTAKEEMDKWQKVINSTNGGGNEQCGTAAAAQYEACLVALYGLFENNNYEWATKPAIANAEYEQSAKAKGKEEAKAEGAKTREDIMRGAALVRDILVKGPTVLRRHQFHTSCSTSKSTFPDDIVFVPSKRDRADGEVSWKVLADVFAEEFLMKINVDGAKAKKIAAAIVGENYGVWVDTPADC